LLTRTAMMGNVSLCEQTKKLTAFLELEKVTHESVRFQNAE
jgi:hypothetical protein